MRPICAALASALALVACGNAQEQDELNDLAKDNALSQHQLPPKAKATPVACHVASEEPADETEVAALPAPKAVVSSKAPAQVSALPAAADPMVTVIYKYQAGGVDQRWPNDFQAVLPQTTIARFPESVWLASANAIPCAKSFSGPGQYTCEFARATNCDSRYGIERHGGETGCAPLKLVQQGNTVQVNVETFVYQDNRVTNPVVVPQ